MSSLNSRLETHDSDVSGCFAGDAASQPRVLLVDDGDLASLSRRGCQSDTAERGPDVSQHDRVTERSPAVVVAVGLGWFRKGRYTSSASIFTFRFD